MRRSKSFWLLIGWVGVICALFGDGVAEASRPEVHLKRAGRNRVQIQGSVLIRQPRDVAWRVLTDYDHLAEFIPDLIESHVIQRTPYLVLQQRGITQFLVFRRTVQVTFRIQEQPHESIQFTAIAGDFLEHQGLWHLDAEGKQIRITYRAMIRPAFFLPPLVGTRLLKQQLRDSLQAIGERIEAVRASTPAAIP